MEATSNLTAIQIATATKLFNKERGRHAEMPCELSYNGDSIFFYWRASRKAVGKVNSCEYTFYPDRYEIVKNIYNQYGCYWEQKTVHEYPATPTETPQIVRVEIVRDFDKSYYANLYDENGGSHNLSHEYTDFRTLKTLCKKEYGVNLPNLSQIEFETHGRKSYACISTETPRISTEAAETVNVSAEGEKETETHGMPSIPEVARMVKTELAKNKAMRTAWHLEFPDGTVCDVRHKCTAAGCDFYEYTEVRESEETFKDYKATERDVTLYICQQLNLEPPQSPETPQTVECTADISKARETARKPQNRGIGSKRATRRDTLRDTLRPVANAPRKCFTADAAHW